MSLLTKFDYLLDSTAAVAFTVREKLLPVQGKDAPVFPPTFAPPEGDKDKKPSYVIDEVGGSLGKVAVIDSVGSQANRLEPIFKDPPYSSLVPQVIVRIGERPVNLLDAGHRAADALIRFSAIGDQIESAFATYRSTGSALPLARLSPTSIVFGVWDSRSTQSKLPRLVSSTIRATDVAELKRSAQFFSSFEKDEAEAIEPDNDHRSSIGMNSVPAPRGLGGVIVNGEIIRDAILNLIPLRSLSAGDPEQTRALQRYILGLALAAFSAPTQLYLREGCLLTADASQPATFELVQRTGQREAIPFAAEEILAFATEAANAFGVGPNIDTNFVNEKAKKPAGGKAKGK